MIDVGVLGPDDRVELIEGEILEMSPEKSRHAAAVDLAASELRRAFGSGYTVRIQHPLALGDRSEPEPDLAVVSGSPRDYVEAHPTTAVLVVEVSDSTLRYDRSTKAKLYAQSGIQDYWVLDLTGHCVYLHRTPKHDGYQSVTCHKPPEEVSALAAPSTSIAIVELLP